MSRYVDLMAAMVALIALGLWTDFLPELTQNHLFWCIHAVGFLGIALVTYRLFPKLESPWSRLLFVVGICIAWRVSYFPFMVFSGHAASIAEWVLVRVPFAPIVIYPVYFVVMASLNAVSAAVVWYLVKPGRPWAYAAAAPLAAIAIMISYTTTSDLGRILPDSVWLGQPTYPRVSLPDHNPYLPRLSEAGYTLPQRVLFFAAGNTYATIPESPWARVVKGVLEAQTDANPNATSADRVFEHYLGYLVAHRFIGCRYDDRATRCQLPLHDSVGGP